MRSLLLGIFGLFLAFVISLFIKSGAWKKVEVVEANLGPMQIVYKDYIGPYHKIITTIQQVETWVKTQGIDCQRSFGEYLDDPNVVEHERLRSRGGCVIAKNFAIPRGLPADFKSALIPQRDYVKGTFEGSPALGPLKVYGRVEEYMESKHLKRAGPVIEIYNVKNETEVETEYLFPVTSP